MISLRAHPLHWGPEHITPQPRVFGPDWCPVGAAMTQIFEEDLKGGNASAARCASPASRAPADLPPPNTG
jgi:hypothetical protein